jgi:hypothetical protein
VLSLGQIVDWGFDEPVPSKWAQVNKIRVAIDDVTLVYICDFLYYTRCCKLRHVLLWTDERDVAMILCIYCKCHFNVGNVYVVPQTSTPMLHTCVHFLLGTCCGGRWFVSAGEDFNAHSYLTIALVFAKCCDTFHVVLTNYKMKCRNDAMVQDVCYRVKGMQQESDTQMLSFMIIPQCRMGLIFCSRLDNTQY